MCLSFIIKENPPFIKSLMVHDLDDHSAYEFINALLSKKKALITLQSDMPTGGLLRYGSFETVRLPPVLAINFVFVICT